jgi:hypothetical protein
VPDTDWDAYFGGGNTKATTETNWDEYFGGAKAAPASDAQDWVRSELFPIKRNIKTGEIKAAYPGLVKDFVSTVKAAQETPQAYDPTTGEVHTSPEMIKAGVQGALVGSPAAPEVAVAEKAVPELAGGLKGGAVAKIENAKAQGRIFSSEQFAPVSEDIRNTLETMNYDPLTHRRVSTALGHVDRLIGKSSITPEAEKNIASFMQGVAPTDIPKLRAKLRLALMEQGPKHSFGDIHNALINLRPAIKSGGTEGAMGEMIQEKIDDYVFNHLPKGPEFLQGRSEYSQARKLDTINEMKDRIENTLKGNQTKAGLAHAMGKEFKKIADNPNKLRLWKPDEQASIKNITRRGDRIILSRLAQFAPTSIGRIGFDSLIGIALGHGVGGALAVVGTGAKIAEHVIAKKRLAAFEKLVSSGGNRAVFEELTSRPRTAQAIRNWANATGEHKRIATIALTSAIAKEVNRPDLQKRLQQEIDNIDPERETVVSKTAELQ